MIALLIFILVFVVVVAVVAFLAIHFKWIGENEQTKLDYQIGKALDRGDHAEATRLRDRKIELMLYGP